MPWMPVLMPAKATKRKGAIRYLVKMWAFSQYSKVSICKEEQITAKYVKDIKYTVYYYTDRFEKWHRILTFVRMHIMDR